MKKLLLLLLCLPTLVEAQTVRADRFTLITGPCTLRSGSGTPEGAVVGRVCDTYWRTDTGVIYTKTSGSGNTGWTTTGITGSGTANTVTKWTGTTSIGNSTTTDDGTDVVLAPPQYVYLNPGGNYVQPVTGYDVNLGHLARKFLSLHAAELWVETLVAQNTMATIGGRILVAPTNMLSSDLAAATTTITVKYNNLASGDRVYMEAESKVEFMAVTSGAGGSAGSYTYTVTRNLDGTGANDWFAGDAIVNTGQTGNGFIDIYSVRGVNAGTEVGPTIVGNVRTSSTYNAWSPRWAIGNLEGLYGYGAATYGAAFGVPSGARVTVDATNGIRIFGGDNDEKVSIDTSGNATFDGRITVGTGRNQIRNSECRVGTEDWTAATNSGLSQTLATFLNPPADYSLNGDSNTCYFVIPGTPANGTISQGYETFLHPAIPAARYEASVYLNTYRTGNTLVYIQWLNAAGSVISTSNGNNCAATAANGNRLASYCRSGIVATAPALTANARIVVETLHNGSTDPYVFWVRAYFGEASAAQEDLTEWGPAGITEITGGMIKTDSVDARIIAAATITATEIAANTITAAKIAAGTITATEIASGTITADRLNVSTLSAISANLGTVTAGSITGGTIDGATIYAGSGDEVTLNSSGITLTGGSGTNNRIKWTGGHEIWGTTGGLYTSGNFTVEDLLVVNGDGGSGVDLTVPDLQVADSINFVNMPVSTGTAVIWESGGLLKKVSSSLRYKNNIMPWRAENAQRLLGLTPISFDYRGDGAKGVVGFSAEEMYLVAPEAVNFDERGRPDSIRQDAVNAYLLQIIKELRAEIDALKAKR